MPFLCSRIFSERRCGILNGGCFFEPLAHGRGVQ